MANDEGEDDKVGYRNPPKNFAWRKGQSGNPKGRPKGSRNFRTVLDNELRSRVGITENGKRKKISKAEAFVKQLVNKAASGDPKVMPTLLKELRDMEGPTAGASMPTAWLREEDHQVIANIVKRLGGGAELPGVAAPSEQTPNSTVQTKEDDQHHAD